MNRLLTLAVLGCSLALAGCSGFNVGGGGTGSVPTPAPAPSTSAGETVASVIKEVQSTAANICSFVPTAQTVSSILGVLGVPYVGVATDIAKQVCAAVNRPGARRGGASAPVVVVHGQPIRVQGRRVAR